MRHYQGLNDTAGTGIPVEEHVWYVFIEGQNGVNRQPSKKFFLPSTVKNAYLYFKIFKMSLFQQIFTDVRLLENF